MHRFRWPRRALKRLAQRRDMPREVDVVNFKDLRGHGSEIAEMESVPYLLSDGKRLPLRWRLG